MAGVDIIPKDAERFTTGRSKVKLYYINPDYHKAHNGNPMPHTVKGVAYTMPELGEFIIIDEVFASDLLGKSGFKGKPIFMLESDGGAEVAALIKEAIASGEDLDQVSIDKVIVRRQLASLSDDELESLMKDRGYAVSKPKLTPEKPKPQPKSQAKSTGKKEEEKEDS